MYKGRDVSDREIVGFFEKILEGEGAAWIAVLVTVLLLLLVTYPRIKKFWKSME